jgi:ligand-binding sensor domain-containing protein
VIGESSDAQLVASAQQLLDKCAWIVYNIADGLPSDEVNALALDGKYVLIGTAAGVVQFDLEVNAFVGEIDNLSGMDIRALAADDFQLWIGTLDSGIKQYDKTQGTWSTYTEDEGLSSDKATAISIDPDSVWIATAFGGVYQYDKYDLNWTNYTTGNGLPSDKIVSIASTPSDVICCGTFKSGVSFLNKYNGQWRREFMTSDENPERSVTSIAFGANYIWFAWYEELGNGFSRYDALTKSWKGFTVTQLPPDTTVAPSANIINLGANDKEMWFGTESEVMFYDYATSELSDPFGYPSELTGHVPKCVLVGDNSIWFATSHGLGRIDRNLIRQIEQIRQGPVENNEETTFGPERNEG